MSIRNRILIPVVAAIVVAYFAIDAAFRNEARQFQVESAQTRIVGMEECQRQVAGECLAIASLFSRMPAVQQAFAMAHEGSIHVEKDERAAKARALLRTELEPFAKGYASVMGGRNLQLHFHLPTGRSLLRLWKADQNVSDDISDFRQTVRDINSGKHEPITGVEVGRGGFAIRGIAAVTGPDGRHLGSVEVLSDYLPVVETAKDNDREQVAVYMNARLLPITTKLADRNKYPLLGDSYVRVMSTDAELTDGLLTPELLGRAKEEAVSERCGKYQVTAFPVTDYRGEQIGTIALVDDLTPWLARLARIRWGVAIGAAFLLAGLALAVYRTSVSVSKPLKKLAQGLQEIAQGKCDLTRRFDASGTGEVAETARGINAVLERLQTILHELATGASHMSDSTVKLSTTATQMACETDHMKGQSNSVAVAAEELTANMRSVAEATEEMSTNARTLATAVEEMTASIADVATNAEQAAEVAEGAAGLAHGSNASIRELGSAAEEIGKVIEVIQDIAEQTNLLALNATIEAARAGEAGKGFAVVATEVKELAKQTGAATEDIRKRIEGIQGRTSEAVAAIGKISEAIGNVSNVSRTIASAVEEQSITTKQIAASVAQSSSAVETVARSVSESATVSQDISRTIAAVDSAVNQTARGAGISQDASSNLMGYTDRLQAMVGQFKTDEVRFHAGPIKAAHGKWHYRLSEMLAGRQQLQSTDVADHTVCAFGKWYYGEGKEEFGNVPAYQKIEAEHLTVHKLAAEIVELYNGGQRTEAAERLGDFRPLVERLFGLLDELEEHAKAELAVPVA